MTGKTMRGSATVEMAYIMPLIFLVFTASMYLMFYYHDKNILAGAAYETAVVGSQKMRAAGADNAGEEGVQEVSETILESLFQSRIRRKLILFSGASVSVTSTDRQIEVTAMAMRKKMRVTVTARSAVTKPEKFIRDHRKLQSIVNKQ